jgi:hypothetical protein
LRFGGRWAYLCGVQHEKGSARFVTRIGIHLLVLGLLGGVALSGMRAEGARKTVAKTEPKPTAAKTPTPTAASKKTPEPAKKPDSKKPQEARKTPELQKTPEPRKTPELRKTPDPTPAPTPAPEAPPARPAESAPSLPTPNPAALIPMAGRPTITGQVLYGEQWREAEVFVVEPGQTVQLGVAMPEDFAAAEIDELSPNAMRPGERVFNVSVANDYRWSVPSGIPVRLNQNRLEWVAPAIGGDYAIGCEVSARGVVAHKTGANSQESQSVKPLTAGVLFHFLVPYRLESATSAVIQGCPIGTYPDVTAKNVRASVAGHREQYRPPEYFVPVTSATAKLRVSEHFRLGDFVTVAPTDSPAFFPFNPKLVAALEGVYSALEAAGFARARIRVLRAFISPHQAREFAKRGIKLLPWNRYQYGDGVIIIVDNDNDGKLDDLNGDGALDRRDALALARIVAGVQKKRDLRGWVGLYTKDPGATLPDTPMVGFDVRGWQIEEITDGSGGE